jgi:hypothetical protein
LESPSRRPSIVSDGTAGDAPGGARPAGIPGGGHLSGLVARLVGMLNDVEGVDTPDGDPD